MRNFAFSWCMVGAVMLLAGAHALAADVVINEALVNPDGTDDDLEWIELHNLTASPISLQDWYIQSSTGTADAFQTRATLPEGMVIPADGYFVIAEELVDTSGVPMTSGVYKPTGAEALDLDLQNAGSHTEGVRLVRVGDAVEDTLIYGSPNTNNIPGDDPDTAGEYPAVSPYSDETLARCPNGADTNYCDADFVVRAGTLVTIGRANDCALETPVPTTTPSGETPTPTPSPTAAAILLPGQVLINEIVYDPEGPDGDFELEWIELFNATDSPLDLTGCRIQNGGTAFYDNVVLPAMSIAAGGYVLLYEADVVPPIGCNPYCREVDFDYDLQNGGTDCDGVRLVDSMGTVIDTLLYDGIENGNDLPDDSGLPGTSWAPNAQDGQSLARCPDGIDTDDSSVDFVVREIAEQTMMAANNCLILTPTPVPTEPPTPVATLTVTPMDCGQQLLTNPGFELWTVPETPDNWAPFGDNITATQNTGTVHGGASSCMITWTTDATRSINQLIGVFPDTFYIFSLYVYDNDVQGKVRIWVQWQDAYFSTIDSDGSDYTVDSTEWQLLSTGPMMAPGNAV
ncbi:lamin tail domain-containing protein, partial [bacterium]|nr:lamin tail domain-containing protein [candidate division CSSED10-310 bacterium]